MKALAILAVLLAAQVSQAQVPTEVIRTLDEGGGAIGNGGEIREIDLTIMIKKIKAFLKTKDGNKEFPMVSAPLLSEQISKTRIQIVDGDLLDSNKNVRSARNFKVNQQATIQFSAKALAAMSDQRSAIYALVFHEYLNLLGLELSSESGVSSIYPISSKIIPYVDQIEKLNVKADQDDFYYFASCTPRMSVLTYRKNWLGSWKKKESEDHSLYLFRPAIHLTLSNDGTVQEEQYNFGSPTTNTRMTTSVRIVGDSFQVDVRMNGSLIGTRMVSQGETEVVDTYTLPGEVVMNEIGRSKKTIDQVTIACQFFKQFY